MADLTGTPTTLGIGTFNVDADAPSGLGFNEAMAQIDTLIAARVNKPAGVQTNDVPIWNGTTWVRPSGTPSSTTYLRGDGTWATLAVPSGAPTGAVTAYIWSTAPSGWALLDGTARNRSGADPGDGQNYSAIFGLVGTQYGTGNGTTTFNLPDARGRALVMVGTHADVTTLGASDGLAVGNRRPKHKHTVNDPTHAHTYSYRPVVSGAGSGSAGGGSDTPTATSAAATGISVGPQTGAEPLDTPAHIVLNWIVKL